MRCRDLYFLENKWEPLLKKFKNSLISSMRVKVLGKSLLDRKPMHLSKKVR